MSRRVTIVLQIGSFDERISNLMSIMRLCNPMMAICCAASYLNVSRSDVVVGVDVYLKVLPEYLVVERAYVPAILGRPHSL